MEKTKEAKRAEHSARWAKIDELMVGLRADIDRLKTMELTLPEPQDLDGIPKPPATKEQ
jgi:hypothetical protein